MNISAKTEYGCIAVLALADSYGTGRPVRIRTIADAHGIPSRFLVQILLQLKSAGLVNSIRGAAGGYQLAKDPAAITLADVMEVIEGTMTDPVMSAAHETSLTKTLLSTWQRSVRCLLGQQIMRFYGLQPGCDQQPARGCDGTGIPPGLAVVRLDL